MLPDVALLEIFHFYLVFHEGPKAWHTLVHVCRKWRNVVFGSPRRLNLRLLCTHKTPVREMLDVWPHLPIEVFDVRSEALDMDNIFAALDLHDRIYELCLSYSDKPGLEKVLAAMQQPFPELTNLFIGDGDDSTPVQTDSFLGGSAPRLRLLTLTGIPFPELPKLLLSATHLVDLSLERIPDSGYISLEAMIAGLTGLASLKILKIEYESYPIIPYQKSQYPPLQTPILLPVLTRLLFRGVYEYLEDFVARVDAPLLNQLDITYLQEESLDTPRLAEFISRAPKLSEARVEFTCWPEEVQVILPQASCGKIDLRISCDEDVQLPCLAQLCSSFFRRAPISVAEHLHLTQNGTYESYWSPDIESNQWLELFLSFPAVKRLHISPEFVPRIAPALQLAVERGTEVLPALQAFFFETLPSEPVREIIRQFAVAPFRTGRTTTVFFGKSLMNN
jgi:hypothetical protein